MNQLNIVIESVFQRKINIQFSPTKENFVKELIHSTLKLIHKSLYL